eukprot:superscaffoldBa00001617_g11319
MHLGLKAFGNTWADHQQNWKGGGLRKYRGKMDGRMPAILCLGYLKRQLKSPAIEMAIRLKLPSVMVQLCNYNTTSFTKWD